VKLPEFPSPPKGGGIFVSSTFDVEMELFHQGKPTSGPGRADF
jgi:hypothetical protein